MILTGRLLLKPRKIDLFVPREVAWLNDPYVVKYSEQRHTKHTIDTQTHYIDSFPGLLYGIHRGDCLIGSVSATIDGNNNVANVGILIGDVFYWDQGFGSEAWRAFCGHLFNDFLIRKVEAGCMAVNIGMIAIAKKAGMTLEGTKTKHFCLEDGTYSDRLEWGLFA